MSRPPTMEECEAEVAAGTMFRCGHGYSETPCSVCPERAAERGRLLVAHYATQRAVLAHSRRMAQEPRPSSFRSRGFNFAAYEAAALTGEVYDE